MSTEPLTGIRGVLLDIQGTVLDARNEAVPGAVDAVAAIHDAGLPLRYVTNIDSVGVTTIARRLERAGIPVSAGEVFSPVAALGSFLAGRRANRCHLVLPPELEPDLAQYAAAPGEMADFVVVGDCKDGFTYARLNEALRQLLNGAALVGLNKGRYYLAEDGPVLDTGAIVTALEYAAATTAYVIGKPSTELLRIALEDMGVEAADAVMVGDDATADVGGGHAVGTHTVLVRTGKFTAAALARAAVATRRRVRLAGGRARGDRAGLKGRRRNER